ncbi:hypothetical protein Gorai_023063, partial [Gossypium raimondii]|nr:hypothetical protein [Gossypium raimondii]
MRISREQNNHGKTGNREGILGSRFHALSLNIDDRGSDLGKGENFSALNKKGKEIINIDVGKDTAGGKSLMLGH